MRNRQAWAQVMPKETGLLEAAFGTALLDCIAVLGVVEMPSSRRGGGV